MFAPARQSPSRHKAQTRSRPSWLRSVFSSENLHGAKFASRGPLTRKKGAQPGEPQGENDAEMPSSEGLSTPAWLGSRCTLHLYLICHCRARILSSHS